MSTAPPTYIRLSIDVCEASPDSYNAGTIYAGVVHSCIPTDFAGDPYDDPGGLANSICANISFIGFIPFHGADKLYRKGPVR